MTIIDVVDSYGFLLDGTKRRKSALKWSRTLTRRRSTKRSNSAPCRPPTTTSLWSAALPSHPLHPPHPTPFFAFLRSTPLPNASTACRRCRGPKSACRAAASLQSRALQMTVHVIGPDGKEFEYGSSVLPFDARHIGGAVPHPLPPLSVPLLSPTQSLFLSQCISNSSLFLSHCLSNSSQFLSHFFSNSSLFLSHFVSNYKADFCPIVSPTLSTSQSLSTRLLAQFRTSDELQSPRAFILHPPSSSSSRVILHRAASGRSRTPSSTHS